MRRILLLCALTIVVVSLAVPASAQTYFSAFLLTSEEQLSVPASSVGYGSFVLSADHSRLDYQLVVWSISDVEAAHFHIGARGTDANTVRTIQMDSIHRTAVGAWTSSEANVPLSSAVVDALFAGRVYVNVHTLQNAGGEIRGQLFQPEAYAAFASGAFETPQVANGGSGGAMFLYNAMDTTIFYRGQVSAMSSGITDAHIHAAPIGTPGPVVKPTPMVKNSLDSLSGRTIGMWTPTDSTNPLVMDNVNLLRQGGLYWNVHTLAHPAGEIRGQILRGLTSQTDTGMWFMSMLSGPQEGAEPNPSNGSGTAILFLTPDRKTLRMAIFFNDLTSQVIGGHIHWGQAGTIPNGGNNVVKPFENTSSLIWTSTDASRPLTSQDIDSLFAGHYYINIHTTNFPEGEIRGQIIPVSQPMAAPSSVAGSTPVSSLMLYQNYPNPFNPSTTIRYALPVREEVKLEVRNALGESVSTIEAGAMDAGEHTAEFDATTLPSGVYYITLTAGAEQRRISTVLNK